MKNGLWTKIVIVIITLEILVGAIYYGYKKINIDDKGDLSIKDKTVTTLYKKSNLSDLEEKEIGPFKFKCYYTPGHSNDSVSFYFDEVNTLFVGDFIFKNTIGRTDLPTGNETDMKNSLARLEEFSNDTKIYSGHGDLTTLEEERKNNPYL